MSNTRRTLGVAAFTLLAVLGTGWALERASTNARPDGSAAVVGPVNANENDPPHAPLAPQPADGPAADSSPEYDRSDLLLSQG